MLFKPTVISYFAILIVKKKKMNNSFKITRVFLLFTLIITLVSCSSDVEDDSIDPIGEEKEEEQDDCATITFTGNVKSIIDSNCIQCHGNGGTSPNLTTLNSIKANANKVKSEVVSRRMPRGGSLTQTEIDAIACWVDNGALDN